MKTCFKLLSIYGLLIMVFSISLFTVSCKKDEDKTSSEKKILTFQFQALSPVVEGTINHSSKVISVTVPGDVNLANLVPTITLSKKATINPASGIPQNFTNPVNYTVTAEDGTTMVYTVTVTGGISTATPESLSGNISQNRILVNRNSDIDYVISDMIYIEGNALLTIEAGTKIVFTNVYAGLNVTENAGLKVAGTAETPVILTGPATNPNKGAWSGVTVASNRADNVWEYCFIENAGQEGFEAIQIGSSAKLSMLHCRVKGSLGCGIQVNGSLGQFSYNQVTTCNEYPIQAFYLENTVKVDSTNLLSGNSLDFIHISSFSAPEQDFTIHKTSVPFLIGGGLRIDKVCTIEPGSTLAIEIQNNLIVGEAGKLVADGTALQPIRFTGRLKEAGAWDGIQIQSKLANSMKNCIIEFAGSDNGSQCLLDIYNGKVNLVNCQFKNSNHYGVVIGSETNVTHSGCTFSGCANGNIYNYDEATTSSILP